MNQVCRLLGTSREDLLSKPSAGRALRGEIARLAAGAGSANSAASQLWPASSKKGIGRARRPHRQCETAAQAPALVGTELAAQSGSGSASAQLGAADHWRIGRQSQSRATNPDYGLFPGAGHRYDPTEVSSGDRLVSACTWIGMASWSMHGRSLCIRIPRWHWPLCSQP